MPLQQNDIVIGKRVILTNTDKCWECSILYVSKSNPLFNTNFGCEGTIVDIYFGRYIKVKWDNGFYNHYGPGNLDLVRKTSKPAHWSKRCISEEHPLSQLRDVIPYDPYGKRTHQALMEAHNSREAKMKPPPKKEQFEKAMGKVVDILTNHEVIEIDVDFVSDDHIKDSLGTIKKVNTEKLHQINTGTDFEFDDFDFDDSI